MANRWNSGRTRRRHVFVEAIEDIGKGADKWDDEEPLTADSEFTVSYGFSETDRSTMLVVIQSFSKRRLSRFRLANQRIGFLWFAACADSQGVMAWRESLRLRQAMNNAPASWLLPIHGIAARRTGRAPCF